MKGATDRPYAFRSIATMATALFLMVSGGYAQKKITYEDDILPIFESACLNCHNADKKKGDLDLSNFSGIMAGGAGGEVADPGEGAASILYGTITHTLEPFMPPRGDKLSKKDADLIRDWINGGMLENKSSKAKKPSGPKIAKLDVDPSAKPEGPPPMPEHLNLEPAVTSTRNTVVNDMACSPWAPLLAITGQKQVLLYNTDTLQLAAILPFPEGFPETLSFHPTGKYLTAGGGVPGKSGTTYTWDITSGKILMSNGREFDSVLAASLRLDLGGVALGGPSRLIKLWDTQTGEEIKAIKKHTDWVTALSYSPDGVLLTTGDRNGGVWVWEAGTGNEFHSLRGHTGGITALSWRADSNIVGTASEDGQVIFWEMNNGGQVKKFTAHGGGALSLDYARTGEFVTSGRNREVKIWKSDFTLKKTLTGFSEMVVETAITHDGKRVFTADWNGVIEAWDANTFEKLGQLSGNPPRIADRISVLQRDLEAAPRATAAARNALHVAEKEVSDAESALSEVTTSVAEQKKQVSVLEKETAQFALALSETNTSLDTLGKTIREELSSALTQAQRRAEEHNALIASATVEFKAIAITPLEETERRLIRELEQLREAAEAQQGDAALKQKVTEAAMKLADHQSVLAKIRLKMTQAESKLTTLQKLTAAIASSESEARSQLQKSNEQLQVLSSSRSDITRNMAATKSSRASANKQLVIRQSALKKAEEHLSSQQKALTAPAAELQKALSLEKELKENLKFWQAAQVNAMALVITSKRDTLKAQQEQETSALESKTRELGTSRSDLSSLEARKATLQAQLEELSVDLASLKQSIADRKPLLEEAERESKDLQKRYLELSAEVAAGTDPQDSDSDDEG